MDSTYVMKKDVFGIYENSEDLDQQKWSCSGSSLCIIIVISTQ